MAPFKYTTHKCLEAKILSPVDIIDINAFIGKIQQFVVLNRQFTVGSPSKISNRVRRSQSKIIIIIVDLIVL